MKILLLSAISTHVFRGVLSENFCAPSILQSLIDFAYPGVTKYNRNRTITSSRYIIIHGKKLPPALKTRDGVKAKIPQTIEVRQIHSYESARDREIFLECPYKVSGLPTDRMKDYRDKQVFSIS
ncbi:hypothetical protein CEXT_790551 [Caerostris extrusa]|uniref:Uncharacterized protein n=1 Tax=Caerostris extrusa TaxID=172846 RepID=A0AAV4T353_CAEEX|nr:hypothetical protein CEXT_790551 [Caerostris extrusa]